MAAPTPTQEYPDDFDPIHLGRFQHAASDVNGTQLGTTDFLPGGFLAERPFIVDSFCLRAETIANAARTIRFVYVNNGQTLAAAISASQFLTDAIDLSTVVAGTLTTFLSTYTNPLLAGTRIGIDLSATSDNALAGLILQMRRRTRI